MKLSFKTQIFGALVLVLLQWCGIEAKVLELSDRFLPLRHEGMWLIMFYAPWCGHCKKLEPIFKHVSQSLSGEEMIRVARIDCTRFPSIATEFSIKGYPTILFLRGENVFSYEGDRTREDIVAFAQRLMGPPVKLLNSEEELRNAVETRDTSFVFIGERSGQLWSTYEQTATTYQQHEFFYQVPAKVAERITKARETQVVRVFKDKNSFKYGEPSGDTSDRGQRSLPDGSTALEEEAEKKDDDNSAQIANPPPAEPTAPAVIANDPLFSWIAQERFPLFIKVTRGKFSSILSTKKYVVIAVLEENKIGELTPEMEEFRDMVKSVIERNRERYHEHFQFGWTGTPDLANSVAMETLSLPNLLVVNSSSFQHHLPDDDPIQLTTEAIQIFLDDVLAGSAPTYGGSSYTVRLYRSFYEVKSSVSEMWKGNPALTAVLFGLPLGFFSLICYSICCADIMDAEEEDEEDADYHEKTD